VSRALFPSPAGKAGAGVPPATPPLAPPSAAAAAAAAASTPSLALHRTELAVVHAKLRVQRAVNAAEIFLASIEEAPADAPAALPRHPLWLAD
jgi:hypothetical protein